MTASSFVTDVDQADFQREVIERSHQVPVIVDFWAPWCGPCKTLGPILQEAVDARAGDVVLVKVDVDTNPGLSQAFRVQGIPAVKAFKDGKVVDEFTGALPPGQVAAFVDGVAPSTADRLVHGAQALVEADPDGARSLFEQAIEADDRHPGAALGLASLLVTVDPRRARSLAVPHRPDARAEALLARLDLAEAGGDVDERRARVDADPTDGDARLELGQALAAQGQFDEAFTHLLAAVKSGGDARELAREQIVQLFTVLGSDHELVRRTRPRLAAALY